MNKIYYIHGWDVRSPFIVHYDEVTFCGRMTYHQYDCYLYFHHKDNYYWIYYQDDKMQWNSHTFAQNENITLQNIAEFLDSIYDDFDTYADKDFEHYWDNLIVVGDQW